MLTQERLKELLDYNPETGIFKWNISQSGRRFGKKAGCITRYGYTIIGIDRQPYFAHRVAWLYMTGEWPKDQIYHINGKRSDNKFTNLRESDRTLNNQNQREAQKSNQSSRLLGVHSSRRQLKPWRARICVNGRNKTLGNYVTKEEAQQSYLNAKRKLHIGCTI